MEQEGPAAGVLESTPIQWYASVTLDSVIWGSTPIQQYAQEGPAAGVLGSTPIQRYAGKSKSRFRYAGQTSASVYFKNTARSGSLSCGEIEKTDSDTQGKPEYQCTSKTLPTAARWHTVGFVYLRHKF